MIYLLGLLGLHSLELPIAAALGSFGTGLGVHDVVPPAEAGGVVADEALVVGVVVVCPSPEREEMTQTPGEIITAVSVDSLEKSADNPQIHGNQVQIASQGDPDDRGPN